MGIGVSLFFIALGAILTWAIDASVSGVNINAVGAILMVVGVIGVVLSVIFWTTMGSYGFGGGGSTPRSSRIATPTTISPKARDDEPTLRERRSGLAGVLPRESR